MKNKKQEEIKPEKTVPVVLDESELEDVSGGEYGDLLRPICCNCGRSWDDCKC